MSSKKPKATRKRMISCFAPLLSHRPPPTTIQGTLPSFKTPVRPEANANMGSCNETIDSANKGIDGIWEWRGTAAPALSRPFYMAATERGPPNISTPFVAETIGNGVKKCHLP